MKNQSFFVSFLLSPLEFSSLVLEPYLDLSLGKAQFSCQWRTLRIRQIIVSLEFWFQVVQLIGPGILKTGIFRTNFYVTYLYMYCIFKTSELWSLEVALILISYRKYDIILFNKYSQCQLGTVIKIPVSSSRSLVFVGFLSEVFLQLSCSGGTCKEKKNSWLENKPWNVVDNKDHNAWAKPINFQLVMFKYYWEFNIISWNGPAVSPPWELIISF